MTNKKYYSKLKHYCRLQYVGENKFSWNFKILSWCKLQGQGFTIAKPENLGEKTPKEYCEFIADIALQMLFDGVKLIDFPIN